MEDKVYKCPECGDSFSSLPDYHEHLGSHLNEKQAPNEEEMARKDFNELVASITKSVEQFDEWYKDTGLCFTSLLKEEIEKFEAAPATFGLDKVFDDLLNGDDDCDDSEDDNDEGENYKGPSFEEFKRLFGDEIDENGNGINEALDEYALMYGVNIEDDDEYVEKILAPLALGGLAQMFGDE